VRRGARTLTRDAANAGKRPDAFLREVNILITKQRRAGHGTLPAAFAFLSIDEVLAVRLFSGPACQPINGFLRELSFAQGRQKLEVGRHPSLTFAATVGHLCAALRKIADVLPMEEANQPLWGGMVGELPPAFWTPPEGQRSLCAVTTTFMSCSRQRSEVVRCMQTEGENVLWALTPRPEDDVGFHRGANIELLSQFAEEQECLFPPGTLLMAEATVESDAKAATEEGRSFRSLTVVPTFL